MRTTVSDQVIAVCELMSGKEANLNSRLADDLELDSLDRISLAMKLEEHFGIEISDEEVDDQKLGIVSGLVAHVEAKVRDRTALKLTKNSAYGKFGDSNRAGAEL